MAIGTVYQRSTGTEWRGPVTVKAATFVAVLMLAASLAWADIGRTFDEFVHRYGQPTETPRVSERWGLIAKFFSRLYWVEARFDEDLRAFEVTYDLHSGLGAAYETLSPSHMASLMSLNGRPTSEWCGPYSVANHWEWRTSDGWLRIEHRVTAPYRLIVVDIPRAAAFAARTAPTASD